MLYRYFKSKQDLIDKVYLHVFMGRWQPQWVMQLRDRAVPLQERLVRFYRDYARATYQPEWIRIYMFAGLESSGLNRRYLQLIKKDLLAPCCQELRDYCGVPDDTPVSEQEIEFYWTLHDGLFYTAIRETIYQSPMEVSFDDKVRYAVENFLAGARTVYPRLVRDARQAHAEAKPGKARRPAAVLTAPAASAVQRFGSGRTAQLVRTFGQRDEQRRRRHRMRGGLRRAVRQLPEQAVHIQEGQLARQMPQRAAQLRQVLPLDGALVQAIAVAALLFEQIAHLDDLAGGILDIQAARHRGQGELMRRGRAAL